VFSVVIVVVVLVLACLWYWFFVLVVAVVVGHALFSRVKYHFVDDIDYPQC